MAAYKTYIIVWGSLLVLTVVTWAVSYIHLGIFNAVVALTIASVKASLVALFFMHLKNEKELVWAFALFPLGFLSLLIIGTLVDSMFR
jgi:cytochrome c oxidase subunit IV